MVETPVGFLYLHECRPRTLEALLLDAKGPRYCRRCNQEATHQAVGGPAPCGGCYEDSLAPFINREACRREQNAASGPSRLLLNVIAALAELERTWIAEATKQRLRVLRNMGKGLGRPLVGSRDRALTGLTDAAIHAKWRELGSMQATARALGRTWAAGGIRWGALRASRIVEARGVTVEGARGAEKELSVKEPMRIKLPYKLGKILVSKESIAELRRWRSTLRGKRRARGGRGP